MNNEIVRINDLSKKYGRNEVLKDINLTLKERKIYGLIGENGAGKTTLMRIIIGLSKETKGECYLFGEKNSNMNKRRNVVGAIIENPALIPELTAYQNMRYKMIMNNINDNSEIGKILHEVGLENTKNKKVQHFSLGMKQRLGIAMALVNNPKLMILDEPINGLDPGGIIEMRNILKNLNLKYGITILISSHILSEMYKLASDYVFLHNGRIVKQLTAGELELEFERCIVVESDNTNKTIEILEKLTDKKNIKKVNESTVNLYNYNDSTEVTKYLVENGIGVRQIYVKEESIEDYYSKIISQV